MGLRLGRFRVTRLAMFRRLTQSSASFTQSQYTLTVNVSPSSGGTVTRNNNGPYNLNDVVVLTESPSAGYTFSAWSGDGTGTGTTRTVTITGNMAVTATYTQNTYTLTVNTSGQGSVSKSPNQATYTYGASVQADRHAGCWVDLHGLELETSQEQRTRPPSRSTATRR